MFRRLTLAAALFFTSTAIAETDIQFPSGPALSPQGERIAFSWNGDIWDVKARGGIARQLTAHEADDQFPVYSRDGTQLAFVSNRSGSDQVYVMPSRGGTPKQITFHSAGYVVHDWFPDGKSLLCTGLRDHHWRDASRLIRVWTDGSRGEQVLADAAATAPSLCPDGKLILFNREGRRWWRKGYHGAAAAQVWLLDIESGRFTKLLHEESDCLWPTWATDGESFYFATGDHQGFDLWSADLPAELRSGEQPVADALQVRRVVDADEHSIVFPACATGSPAVVYRHGYDLFRWEPKSKHAPRRVAIRTRLGGGLEQDLSRRELDRAEEVAFTPDGLEIAFIAGGDVWVMDTELREPVQVTKTPEHETSLVWAPDGNSLWFVSNRDAQADIFRVERADGEQYWWRNTEFTVKLITQDAPTESRLSFDASGQRLFYVRGNGQLWSMDIETSEPTMHVDAFLPPDYDVSPDGRWLAYALQDDNFNSDIYLVPVDGAQLPYNVSRHPDNDNNPRFSNDGKVLAFTGSYDQDSDIYYVYLQNELDDQSSRDRKLAEAIKKMEEKRSATSKEDDQQESAKEADEEEDDQATDDESDDAEESAIEPVEIDLQGIEERVRRIRIPDVEEQNLVWLGDEQQLAFVATIKGERGIYSVVIPEKLDPEFLTSETGSDITWSKAATALFMNSDGKPTTVDLKGKSESYSFAVVQEVSRRERFAHAFDIAWRTIRDRWYDERLGGKNWDQVRRTYRPMAASATDAKTLGTVIQMMLGELNGSHLGFYPNRADRYDPPTNTDRTAHLGLRFDPSHKGPGLKIRDVLPDSPADKEAVEIAPGDLLLEIDGMQVDPECDLTGVLNGLPERDVRLKVQNAGDEQATEYVVRPSSYAAARQLLYRKWVSDTREKVRELSEDTLGYLHIRSMNQDSFDEFERQLYAAGHGKQGMVIDVRDNGGGWTADYLLTALTQPRHAVTIPRGGGPGYPQDRKVFASWQKPIVVLCNQNSFSNAEIFSHAIKTLGRGKLVGVPTAGGVISTGSVSITDVGRMRMPFRGWFVLGTGADMELNGAVPDVVLWPEPGQIPAGVDPQLQRAVQLLQEEVSQQLNEPTPRYAVERESPAADDESDGSN